MSEKIFKLDYSFMSAQKVGNFGFKETDLASLSRKLAGFNRKLEIMAEEPDLSFRQLPYDQEAVELAMKLAGRLKRQFTNLVIVGIGGSDLGSRAIYSALAGNYGSCIKRPQAMAINFLGDTTDPQPVLDLLKILDLKKTVFYIVSKSGDTIEPLSNFLLLREQVIKLVGYKNHKKHFIVTTNLAKGLASAKTGALLEIAQKEGYLVLGHYPGGGRFSVLSVHGLLPAACAGFDLKKLLAGAKAMDQLSKNNSYLKNLPWLFAAMQYLAYKKGQNISVLMPYNYYLRNFALWFRQLWAENLGKQYNWQKKKVNVGITPVAALGPTDQHSQVQLYIEGPFDKIITFIKVKKLESLKVPNYRNSEISYLGGHEFSEILNIEHKATAVSLMKNKRPNCTIILPELNEYYLGQIFMFFEMTTVYLGELLQINVFNQPGVEQSKRYMYGLLGKKGFEKEKREILSI
ncbi:MAG: glucose-6-phosphate isomerase [Patescibacteria group bacterium]